MNSGQDLFLELQHKISLLDTALGELGKSSNKHAEAEMNYRVKLAEKILIEREEGTPVTIISDICRGYKEIARLKFERDCAEVSFKASLEAINVFKIQIKSLEAQMDREYNRR